MIKKAQETVGNNIKRYRTEKKLTQEQLSEMCSISCDYLSEIERGKRHPSMKRLDVIAEALNIDSYKLLMP